MNLELLYATFVIVVTLAWLLLIVAPKWTWTQRTVHSVWIPLAAGVWALTLQMLGPPSPAGAGMGTVQAVVLLVGEPHGIFTMWTTGMGWDLIAGAWFSCDARRHRIHHGWVVLCLLVAYFLGILGLGLYLLIRIALRRDLSMDERAA